jgi:hypothetical protein
MSDSTMRPDDADAPEEWEAPDGGTPRARDGVFGDGLLDRAGDPAVHDGDPGSDASGSQSTSAVTADVVDSGQSEDIENALSGAGISDRETTVEEARDEADER